MSRAKKALPEGRLALGTALRARREEAGWTLRELSSRSGLSVAHLADAERGEGNLSLEALVMIADAYGVLAVDLLQGVQPYGSR